MNKSEMLKLMIAGKKMTHRFFTPEEYVSIEGYMYQFEDGCRCSEEEFWSYRTAAYWQEDWSVYKDITEEEV